MLYRVHPAWMGFECTILVVIGSDCSGSCNPTTIQSWPWRPLTYNHDHDGPSHTITTMMVPNIQSRPWRSLTYNHDHDDPSHTITTMTTPHIQSWPWWPLTYNHDHDGPSVILSLKEWKELCKWHPNLNLIYLISKIHYK